MNLKIKIKKYLLLLKGNPLNILDYTETIKKIYSTKKSLVRFGDGELDIIMGGQEGFQRADIKLRKRLQEVLSSNNEDVLIGIPDVINYSFYKTLTKKSEEYWVQNMWNYRDKWLTYLNKDQQYVTANVTRFYIRNKNKKECSKLFENIKEIWLDRNILIVEGNKTRFGINNDLLSDAKSIQRIICPAENAFDYYEEILQQVKCLVDKDTLILAALGPSATILAYDLAVEGYQTIDIGHLDLEYEWYKLGVKEKVKITGKYVNEITNGKNVSDIADTLYDSQIIFRVDAH